MRLIDADERVTVQNYDPCNEEYSHDEMTVADALDFATDEGCPPTIDAIPVEWILNKVGDEETYTLKFRHAWGQLVGLWTNEQEAR